MQVLERPICVVWHPIENDYGQHLELQFTKAFQLHLLDN